MRRSEIRGRRIWMKGACTQEHSRKHDTFSRTKHTSSQRSKLAAELLDGIQTSRIRSARVNSKSGFGTLERSIRLDERDLSIPPAWLEEFTCFVKMLSLSLDSDRVWADAPRWTG